MPYVGSGGLRLFYTESGLPPPSRLHHYVGNSGSLGRVIVPKECSGPGEVALYFVRDLPR